MPLDGVTFGYVPPWIEARGCSYHRRRVLPSNRPMGMCTGWGRICTIGLTIIGNNGFAFSEELLELGLRFSGF